jgi:nickel-dependent lactate racemase
MIINVPQMAWYDPSEFAITLPDKWRVQVNNMVGNNRLHLKPEEIKKAVRNPIGILPLRELAKDRKDVVILIDDMTRVTRDTEIIPYILEELAAAGIPDERIRFIMALGCHAPRDRRDFAKKLGEDVLARFPVYNHNAFDNCTYIGTTETLGTKVHINEEVMKCDLKIGISLVSPHALHGFSGGGKIVLPGVASYDCIQHNHAILDKLVAEERQAVSGMGVFDNNLVRVDTEEAAIMVGLDVSVNCIVNSWGETVAIYAGELKRAFGAAVSDAKKNYSTPVLEGQDIVIANTYTKVSEAWVGLFIAYPAVKPEGGDIVLIANTPEGQVTHYLMGPFGKTSFGPIPYKAEIPANVNRLIIYTEYPDLAGRGYFGESDKIIYLNRWEDVVRTLEDTHGNNASVAVYPAAEIQYCI